MQILWLMVLALVVACVAWTVTHEEIFREPREYCQRRARTEPRPMVRKCFYVVTCEFCFSHWVALGVVALMRFRLLVADWRGYVLSFFAVVAIANLYMSAFGRLRQEVKSEGLEAKRMERALDLAGQGEEGVAAAQPPPGPSSESPSGRAARAG